MRSPVRFEGKTGNVVELTEEVSPVSLKSIARLAVGTALRVDSGVDGSVPFTWDDVLAIGRMLVAAGREARGCHCTAFTAPELRVECHGNTEIG